MCVGVDVRFGLQLRAATGGHPILPQHLFIDGRRGGCVEG